MLDFLIWFERSVWAGPAFAVGLGFVFWLISVAIARAHERSLQRREAGPRLPILAGTPEGRDPQLVIGSVVLSHSLSRMLLTVIRQIIGGRLRLFQDSMDRARREALLRLEDAARAQECDALYNLRLTTTSLDGGRSQAALAFEIMACATAVKMPSPMVPNYAPMWLAIISARQPRWAWPNRCRTIVTPLAMALKWLMPCWT